MQVLIFSQNMISGELLGWARALKVNLDTGTLLKNLPVYIRYFHFDQLPLVLISYWLLIFLGHFCLKISSSQVYPHPTVIGTYLYPLVLSIFLLYEKYSKVSKASCTHSLLWLPAVRKRKTRQYRTMILPKFCHVLQQAVKGSLF